MKVANIDIKKTAIGVVGTLIGVAAGSAAKKALTSSQSVEGLAGNAKNYIVPGIIFLGGAVAAGMTNDEFLRPASLGMAAVGGASIANELAGKQLVSLGSTQTSMPRRRFQPQRGVAGTLLPGMSGQNETQYPGMSGKEQQAYSLIQ